MWGHATLQRGRERTRQLDRIAVDRDVDVEALLSEEDVADGSSHEVDAARTIPERRHRVCERTKPLLPGELVREALAGFLPVFLEAFERPQQISPSHDAHELAIPEHGHTAVVRARHELLELRERRVLGRCDHASAHDAPDRRVREPMADGLVQVFSAHSANDAAFVDDEDPALPMPLAEHHRVAHALLRRDRARRSRHHVPCAAGVRYGLLGSSTRECSCLVETAVLGNEILARAVPQTPRERVGIALRGRRASVSEPVASWIPSANTNASSEEGSSPRSARIPTSVVVSAPSSESTTASGSTQTGSSASS